MESLGELINLITKKRIKKVELFDESSRNKQSNYYKLFEGIHSEKYKTDADAARDIYQCDPSEKKYLILKTRLKQKLLNTLYFLDMDDKSVSEAQSAMYECSKALFYSKVLLLNNTKRIAIPTLEKVYRKAHEFSLTDIELESARMLRQHMSQNGSYKDFLMYRIIVEITEKKAQIENMAESFYQESRALFNKSKSNREKVRKTTQEQYQKLEPYLNEFISPIIRMNYYKLKALHYQLSDDYKSAVDVVVEAEQYISENMKHFTKNDLAKLSIKKMNYYLHLRDFEQGEAAVKTSIEFFIPGGNNWVTLHEYYFLLAMHTKNYLKAAEIFQAVVMQSKFRLLSKLRKERWKVFQAYLHFIYKDAGLKEIRQLTQNSKTGFKLNEFMVDLPEFSKKQRGLGIAKLVVQTLYHLEKMNLEYVGKCTDAISMYSRRYPKKDINFRSECLINLLMNMKAEDFRFYQTRKSSEKHYDELTLTTMQYLGGNRGLEVMPYEVLWDMVLDKLKNYRYG